jgi:hypothetical protein
VPIEEHNSRTVLDEPISPELALVCPETARRARDLLPARDPEASIPQACTVAAASPHWLERTTVVAGGLYFVFSTLRLVATGIVLVTAVVLVLTLAAGWSPGGR